MRYLSKFNESNEEVGLDFVIAKIKEKFSESDVKGMYEKEKEVWSDDYDSDGNGEAEEIILEQMISWFKRENKSLSEDLFKEVYNKLQEVYTFLKH